MDDIDESQKYLRVSRISKWLQWLFGFFIGMSILLAIGVALTIALVAGSA